MADFYGGGGFDAANAVAAFPYAAYAAAQQQSNMNGGGPPAASLGAPAPSSLGGAAPGAPGAPQVPNSQPATTSAHGSATQSGPHSSVVTQHGHLHSFGGGKGQHNFDFPLNYMFGGMGGGKGSHYGGNQHQGAGGGYGGGYRVRGRDQKMSAEDLKVLGVEELVDIAKDKWKSRSLQRSLMENDPVMTE